MPSLRCCKSKSTSALSKRGYDCTRNTMSSFKASIYLNWSLFTTRIAQVIAVFLIPIALPIILYCLNNVRSVTSPPRETIEITPIPPCRVFDVDGYPDSEKRCVTLAYAPDDDPLVQAVIGRVAAESNLTDADVMGFGSTAEIQSYAYNSFGALFSADSSFLDSIEDLLLLLTGGATAQTYTPLDLALSFNITRDGDGFPTAVNYTIFHNETVSYGRYKVRTGDDPMAQLYPDAPFSGVQTQLQLQVNRALFQELAGSDFEFAFRPLSEVDQVGNLNAMFQWDLFVIYLAAVVPAILGALSVVSQRARGKYKALRLMGINLAIKTAADFLFFGAVALISAFLFSASSFIVGTSITVDTGFGFVLAHVALFMLALTAFSLFFANIITSQGGVIALIIGYMLLDISLINIYVSISYDSPQDPTLRGRLLTGLLTAVSPGTPWISVFAFQVTETDPYSTSKSSEAQDLLARLDQAGNSIICRNPIFSTPHCYEDESLIDYRLGVEEFDYSEVIQARGQGQAVLADGDEESSGETSSDVFIGFGCYFTDCYNYSTEEHYCLKQDISVDGLSDEEIAQLMEQLCTYTYPLMWKNLLFMLCQTLGYGLLSAYMSFVLPTAGMPGLPPLFFVQRAYYRARRQRKQLERFQLGEGLRGHARGAVVFAMSDLSFSYGGACKDDFLALNSLTTEFRAGDSLGLIGYNGAGKTTLFRVITGQVPSARVTGTIMFQTPSETPVVVDLTGRYANYITQGFFSLALQSNDLIWPSLSVEQHMRLAFLTKCALYNKVQKRAPEQFSEIAFTQDQPEGADPRNLMRRVVEDSLESVDLLHKTKARSTALSGGMQRRLSAAMALVGFPLSVLLDEPTTGLDPHARRVLWKILLRHQARGCTTVLCSHDMEEVQALCSRVVMLRSGAVLVEDDIDELLLKQTSQLIRVLPRPPCADAEPLVRDAIAATEVTAQIERSRNGSVVVSLGLNEPATVAFLDVIAAEPAVRPPEVFVRSLEEIFQELNEGQGDDEHEGEREIQLPQEPFIPTLPPSAARKRKSNSHFSIMFWLHKELENAKAVFLLLFRLIIPVVGVLAVVALSYVLQRLLGQLDGFSLTSSDPTACISCCTDVYGTENTTNALLQCVLNQPDECFSYKESTDGDYGSSWHSYTFNLVNPVCPSFFRASSVPMLSGLRVPTVTTDVNNYHQAPGYTFQEIRNTFSLFGSDGNPLAETDVGRILDMGLTGEEFPHSCDDPPNNSPDDVCYLSMFESGGSDELLLTHFPYSIQVHRSPNEIDVYAYCNLEVGQEDTDAYYTCGKTIIEQYKEENSMNNYNFPLVYFPSYVEDNSLFTNLNDFFETMETAQRERAFNLNVMSLSASNHMTFEYSRMRPISAVTYDPRSDATHFDFHSFFPPLKKLARENQTPVLRLIEKWDPMQWVITYYQGTTTPFEAFDNSPIRFTLHNDLIQRLFVAELRRRLAEAGTVAASPVEGIMVRAFSEPLPYALDKGSSNMIETMLDYLAVPFVFLFSLLTSFQTTRSFVQTTGAHRSLLRLNGMRRRSYWFSLVVFNLLVHAVICLVFALLGTLFGIATFVPNGSTSTFGVAGNIPLIFLILFSQSIAVVATCALVGAFGLSSTLSFVIVVGLVLVAFFLSQIQLLSLLGAGTQGVSPSFLNLLIPTSLFSLAQGLLFIGDEGHQVQIDRIVRRGEFYSFTEPPSVSFASLFNGSDMCVLFVAQLAASLAYLGLAFLVDFLFQRKRTARTSPAQAPPGAIVDATVPAGDDAPLAVEHLTKEFPALRALSDVTFAAADRQVTAIIGENGAGKSTLINCIIRNLTPTAGRVFSSGTLVSSDRGGVPVGEVHRYVSVCPQHDVLWPNLRVQRHLTLLAELRGEPQDAAKMEALRIAAMLGLADSVAKKSSDLSGGMQRRLSLGMAISGRPNIVIADEPTTGLDPVTRRAVWNAVESVGRERAIILTTHSMVEAEALPKTLIFLHQGRVIFSGTAPEFRRAFYQGHLLSLARADPAADGAIEGALAEIFERHEVLKATPSLVQVRVFLATLDLARTVAALQERLVAPGLVRTAILRDTTLGEAFQSICEESHVYLPNIVDSSTDSRDTEPSVVSRP
eukprot:gnl/Chilomastix_cuspidata/563.p1 GENE.gnl/Chilomastix_cuspidata/563~~gnl/Chilomastix_cuspidata/563.p1  ORF type:complete len:2107 (-),score=787.46 gnl/Chilomastix_cuspidata/563:4358-10678(-)